MWKTYEKNINVKIVFKRGPTDYVEFWNGTMA